MATKLKVNPRTRRTLYKFFNYKCLYCNRNRVDTLDHIVPRHEGGANALTNLIPCCSACNHNKDAKMLHPNVVTKLLELAEKASRYAIERHRQVDIRFKRRAGFRIRQAYLESRILYLKGEADG